MHKVEWEGGEGGRLGGISFEHWKRGPLKKAVCMGTGVQVAGGREKQAGKIIVEGIDGRGGLD